MIYDPNIVTPVYDEMLQQYGIEGRPRTRQALKQVREMLTLDSDDEDEVVIDLQDARNTYIRPSTKNHIIGLDNFGNTCYLNTIIQSLKYTKKFNDMINDMSTMEMIYKKYSLSSSYHESMIKLEDSTLMHIKKLFQSMNNDNKKIKSIKPFPFRNNIRQKDDLFNNDNQQDVHEAFTSIMEIVHNEMSQKMNIPTPVTDIENACKMHWSDNYSPIYDLFHGMYYETRTCTNCNHCTTKYTPNICLSLNIPKLNNVNHVTDYSKYIVIKSKVSTVKLDDFEIQLMIDCLLPNTKRHLDIIDRNLMERSHSYTITECLEEYTKESVIEGVDCSHCNTRSNATCSYGISIAPKILVIQLKRFSYDGSKITNPINIELTYDITIDSKVYSYKLSSLINHNGHNTSCGHYYSYSYSEENSCWYMFNDSKIIKTAINNINTAETYMIFYELN